MREVSCELASGYVPEVDTRSSLDERSANKVPLVPWLTCILTAMYVEELGMSGQWRCYSGPSTTQTHFPHEHDEEVSDTASSESEFRTSQDLAYNEQAMNAPPEAKNSY